LNAEAIQICQLSLWIKTAARGKQLTSLDHTIREGNSIISDPAVYPKALDWQAAFPEVFAQGGVSNVAPVECWAGAGQSGSSATSQSLTHPLPHPVPELARSEHLDVRHPGENPARQFLATGGLQAELQRAVPALPQCLARVPHPFADAGGHLAGEEQAHLPGFVGLADAEGVFEEGGGVEAGRAREVLAGPCERTAAGQGKGLRAPGGCV
jgi:hypothetical protein